MFFVSAFFAEEDFSLIFFESAIFDIFNKNFDKNADSIENLFFCEWLEIFLLLSAFEKYSSKPFSNTFFTKFVSIAKFQTFILSHCRSNTF